MSAKNGVRDNTGLNLEDFISAKEVEAPTSLEEFTEEEIERFKDVGIDLSGHGRLGTFLQANCGVVACQCLPEGLELLPITEALSRYDWLKEKYYWKAVSPEKDSITRLVAEDLDNGYFVRIRAGEKAVYPLQACLYIRTDRVAQKVHNIVLVEEEAELHLITGCTSSPQAIAGLHLGVSEFYIKKGGKLTYTMVHEWGEKIHVRPRTGIVVEEGGTIISNYISLDRVASVESFPVCRLTGPGAVGQFTSIIAPRRGPPGPGFQSGT